jgi:hypothetical protein
MKVFGESNLKTLEIFILCNIEVVVKCLNREKFTLD